MPSAPAAPVVSLPPMTPVPSSPMPEPAVTQAAPLPSVAQPASAAQTPAPVEKPKEVVQPAPETPVPNAISEGIELPDWLLAQLQGKPAEPTAPQTAAARPAVPLPDWLKPASQTPAAGSVVDWEKAAGQPVPSTPADATRPAPPAPPSPEKPAPSAGEVPTWLDKSKPSGNETVARWLDRRLKTSTLSSLEDAIAKPGSKPLSQPPPARPAQSSTQLPTWLDSQKPGGSDTVVRWMDKRETGSLRKGPTSAFSDAGKGAFPTAEGTPAQKPNTAQFASPAQPPAPGSGTEDTVASRKPATQEIPMTPRPGMEPARPAAPTAAPIPAPKPPEAMRPPTAPMVPPPAMPAALPEEEEEEGAFVPPPEWLQKALGSAVADVPPIPREQPAVPEPPKPQPQPASQAPAPVVEKPAPSRWQAQPAEEPAPIPTAKPTPWVPISVPQPVSEAPAKPVKKTVKKKTRKLTDIESEAMIREARVYLETDLQKATDVYQRIIENPASAEVVANDLTTYLEQDPASPQLWNLLGDACSRAGRFQDAYKAYAEALRRM